MRRFDALRIRAFRRFFLAQAVSQLGDRFAGVALVFAVLDLTGSAADVGIVLAARTIPLTVMLLVGGVLADRLPRRTVMVAADLVRFVSQGASAALVLAGHVDLTVLAVLQIPGGVAAAVFMPAVNGLIQLSVPAEKLQEANALRSGAQSAATIAGPALAGWLVVATGAGWALALDALSYLVSAWFLAGTPAGPARAARGGVLKDFAEGWSAFAARRWIWSVIAAACLANMMFAGFSVLGPASFAHRTAGAEDWGTILAAFGIGSLGGSVLTAAGPRHRPLRTGLPLFALVPLPLFALAGGVPLPVVLAASFVSGAALVAFNAIWDTALQRNVPAEVLSRITSFEWLGSYLAQPLGLLLCAQAAGQFGVGPVLYGAGVVQAVVVLVPLALRDVRSLGAAAPSGTGVEAEPDPVVAV
jgi:MFS family permease